MDALTEIIAAEEELANRRFNSFKLRTERHAWWWDMVERRYDAQMEMMAAHDDTMTIDEVNPLIARYDEPYWRYVSVRPWSERDDECCCEFEGARFHQPECMYFS